MRSTHSYTARELNLSRPAVWLVTLMVLCENSYTTISRELCVGAYVCLPASNRPLA